MKGFVMATALVLMAATAFAADSSAGKNFDKIKSETIERINGRISRDQQELACVQAAKSDADIKACSQKFHDTLKGQQDENINTREDRRERWKQQHQ